MISNLIKIMKLKAFGWDSTFRLHVPDIFALDELQRGSDCFAYLSATETQVAMRWCNA